jgi:hypothetical protein
MKTYGQNRKAYFDSFGGLIAIWVIEVVEGSTNHGSIRARILKDVAGYKRGEIVTLPPHKCIPCRHIIKRHGRITINTNYAWQ